MTFDDLNLTAPLLKALDEQGYTTPTTIQQKAFSVIMSGQDVCGIAQTGTGKTLAYLLPTLRQLTWSKDRNPQMLILVPTRELVVQVLETAKKMTAHLSLEVAGVYGGVNINPQKDMVEQGLDVLIATPGRLFDLAASGSLRLKGIRKLVIDEMDEMLNLGFRTQLTNILDMLPPKRQNLLFSATIPEELAALIDTYFNSNIARIEAAPAGTPLENIQQSAYEVPNFYTKINLLIQLLLQRPEMSKVLVFVATKSLADDLYEEMAVNFPDQVGVIHSNKEQNYRFNTVKQFQNGTYRFIIATDIVARGIDISEVTHVINFDLPEVPENYIHRIGRTGRADKNGIAISFITPREKEQQEAIEALMKYAIPVMPLPDDLEISSELTADEMPKVHMKVIPMVLPDKNSGASFHEKKAKNTKVNQRVSHAEKMMQKYGKPKKRPKKR